MEEGGHGQWEWEEHTVCRLDSRLTLLSDALWGRGLASLAVPLCPAP